LRGFTLGGKECLRTMIARGGFRKLNGVPTHIQKCRTWAESKNSSKKGKAAYIGQKSFIKKGASTWEEERKPRDTTWESQGEKKIHSFYLTEARKEGKYKN